MAYQLILEDDEMEHLREIVRHSDQNGNGYRATKMRYYSYLKDIKRERAFRDIDYRVVKKVLEGENGD